MSPPNAAAQNHPDDDSARRVSRSHVLGAESEGEAGLSPSHKAGLIVLNAALDAALGSRHSAREIACRTLALAIRAGHWRVKGIPLETLAAKIGVTPHALRLRVRALPGQMKNHTACAERELSASVEGKSPGNIRRRPKVKT